MKFWKKIIKFMGMNGSEARWYLRVESCFYGKISPNESIRYTEGRVL
jgi:hypothetical protein